MSHSPGRVFDQWYTLPCGFVIQVHIIQPSPLKLPAHDAHAQDGAINTHSTVGQQECQEEPCVVQANTVVDPATMVVKPGYTTAGMHTKPHM